MPPLNAGPLLAQRDPEGALGGLRRLVRDLRLVCTRILTAPGAGAGMNVRIFVIVSRLAGSWRHDH